MSQVLPSTLKLINTFWENRNLHYEPSLLQYQYLTQNIYILNTFRGNRNLKDEPGFLIQHQYLTLNLLNTLGIN